MYKQLYIVLVCFGLLSSAAYASPYGAQVTFSSTSSFTGGNRGMSGSTTDYRPSQTVINMSSTIRTESRSSLRPSGHFTTYVPALNAYGEAVPPGPSYAPSRPRRVIGDGDEDDWYQYEEPNQDSYVAPVGDLPLWFLTLLLASHILYTRRKKKTLDLLQTTNRQD